MGLLYFDIDHVDQDALKVAAEKTVRENTELLAALTDGDYIVRCQAAGIGDPRTPEYTRRSCWRINLLPDPGDDWMRKLGKALLRLLPEVPSAFMVGDCGVEVIQLIHKVYVAASDKRAAEHVADVLLKDHFDVVSTWHADTSGDPFDKSAVAARNVDQVKSADALVVVDHYGRVPGGKFVEAGVALGLGKRVIILGARENLLLHHPSIVRVNHTSQVRAALHA
jgi:hypothetical protein